MQAHEESDRTTSKDQVDITAKEVEKDSAGLPIGVQVVSRHWREDVVLAVMGALESYFSSQPVYPIQSTHRTTQKIQETAVV